MMDRYDSEVKRYHTRALRQNTVTAADTSKQTTIVPVILSAVNDVGERALVPFQFRMHCHIDLIVDPSRRTLKHILKTELYRIAFTVKL